MWDFDRFKSVYHHFRSGGLEASRRYLAEYGHNHAHVLSSSPPVVYLMWGRNDYVLHETLSEFKLTVLYVFPWCYSSNEIPKIKSHLESINIKYPGHDIIFLCNEQFSCYELRANGINAEYIHQNAFVNEHIFSPKPQISRSYDAVYSASMAPYKRHLLASNVKSLIIMAYSYGGTTSDSYASLVRSTLAHACWAKDSTSDDHKLPVECLVEIYAQAHVGLCLSAVEGGMFVSMEYLLSGLPIVTTESIGGRSAFWDDRYVIVCEDSPIAVSDAVAELKRRSISPDEIRSSTLEKIAPHRARLSSLLQSLGAELHCPWPPGSHGTTSFTDLKILGNDIVRELAD